MEEILHRFNPWWTDAYAFPGTPRAAPLKELARLVETGNVVLLAGLRRVGKTTLLHQYVHSLLERVAARRIFYVSLDNLALRDYTILDIVTAYRSICALRHDEQAYLLLDEVHFKPDYELQLKNLHDMGEAGIVASGSASLDLIMRSPHLTGRQRLMRLPPLSFAEYLEFTGETVSEADSHLYPALARDYIAVGGLPEYVLTRDPNALQALLDSLLYRDIAAQHDVRNRESLKDVLLCVAQSVASPISVKRMARIVGIKHETVQRLLVFFAEAGLIHIVEKHGKLSERKVSPRKFYLADTGLLGLLADRLNFGAQVENAIYLKLFNSGADVIRYHRKDRHEVDFVQGRKTFEAKYRKQIESRELEGLVSLRGYESRTIVTEDTEGERDGIQLVPLWRFLLAG